VEGAGRSRLVGVRGALYHRPAKLLELGRVGDGGGELEVLTTVGVRLLERAADHDDTVRLRQLQLEVGVVRDHHEFGVARTLEDGVVRSLKIYYLKDHGLGAEVVVVTEHDQQLYIPQGVRPHAWNDPKEEEDGSTELGPRDAHGIEGLNI
jgi:hypothetical protein